MAKWLAQASQWHEMYCHDGEVMSSNSTQVEFGVRSTSALSRTWTKNIMWDCFPPQVNPLNIIVSELQDLRIFDFSLFKEFLFFSHSPGLGLVYEMYLYASMIWRSCVRIPAELNLGYVVLLSYLYQNYQFASASEIEWDLHDKVTVHSLMP